MANQDRSRGKRPALGALLIAAVVTGASYAAGNPNAKEFASLPSDIGAPFLRASLDETSLKVLAMPTPKVPTEKYNLADTPYKTDPPELARFLVLEGTTGPVTPKEIRGLERYLLEYPLPKCNTINYYFRKHYIPWLLEWVYERTRNPALLEKAIRLAYSAAAHRNDRFGAENIGNEGPVAMWPHYREKNEWRNGKLVLHGDSAHFCGLSFQAVPARMIARHPMCWDRTLEGVTYKQIAFDLVRESMKSTEFMNRVVRDPETNLLIGPSLWGSQTGEVLTWNRVFSYMIGTLPLIDALEAFGIEPEHAETLDAVNAAMLRHFFKTMWVAEVDGKPRYVWAYRLKREGTIYVEGFGHGGFDLKFLELLYQSGRYPEFSETWVRRIADTIASCCKGPGQFSSLLNGNAHPEKGTVSNAYSYVEALEGYLWLAPYRDEIRKCILEYTVNDLMADGLDSRTVWEVLKLRDQK